MAKDRWRTRWQVESFTDTTKKYTVAQDWDDVWGCSCPHWRFRRKDFGGLCKHILFVIESSDSERSHLLARQFNFRHSDLLRPTDWKVFIIEDNRGKKHVAMTRDFEERE